MGFLFIIMSVCVHLLRSSSSSSDTQTQQAITVHNKQQSDKKLHSEYLELSMILLWSSMFKINQTPMILLESPVFYLEPPFSGIIHPATPHPKSP